jgi:4a-hydroxytetrahydrobiopterin dehydratase
MSINNGHKQSPAAVLSSVTAEMAKPRVAESAKRTGDKAENGATAPSPKETPVPPGRGGPLQGEELGSHLSRAAGWELVHDHHIVRNFEFPDFRSALAFVVQIGEVAEQQKHHPDIQLGWGKVQATTWTHEVGGLSENDFILAGKINQIPR